MFTLLLWLGQFLIVVLETIKNQAWIHEYTLYFHHSLQNSDNANTKLVKNKIFLLMFNLQISLARKWLFNKLIGSDQNFTKLQMCAIQCSLMYQLSIVILCFIDCFLNSNGYLHMRNNSRSHTNKTLPLNNNYIHLPFAL